jgi:ferric-dicitrate binding protein FerR (iron transport regulator)
VDASCSATALEAHVKRECREVESLLDRRRAGLTEPERLVLEEHLSECPACARSSAQLYGVLGILEQLPGELTPAQRERVLSRAFAAAERPAPRLSVPRSSYSWVAALVAAAVLLVWLAPRLSVGPAPLAQGRPELPQPVPAPALEELPAGAERSFAHARVRATSAAQVRFSEADGTLELARGAVHVEVDPRPHAPFRVRTAALVAEVLGTVFDMSEEEVAVAHGHVRVSSPSGSALADLHAGERYRRPARGPSAEPPSDLAGAAEPAVEAPAELPVQGASEASVSAARLLARARGALARRDVVSARALATRAEQAKPRRADRAEAGTLRAECALVEGELGAALTAYLAVSDAYRDLAAGENALFAAIKLAERSGDGRAEALRSRYRQRYPRGRFADR